MGARGFQPKDDSERVAAMAALYVAGQTLQQIGDAYGVSRERVRQLIGRVGLAGKDGGAAVLGRQSRRRREIVRTAKRDKRSAGSYGCSHAEVLRLNDFLPVSDKSGAAYRFVRQRTNAKSRGIAWELTFPEWMAVWAESGSFDQRGRGKDGYCMARYGDTGAYAPGNVYITTCANNVSDYQAVLKVRGVVCADGYTRLPERAAALSNNKHD